ncbi:DUF222 domain-containing protein [Williamsia sp. MIQD14]|uniref:HNH endonuclease signature motif containing protein n=1 Tax=Williamsia sp. MIQD14 TaxID=3425703 RepID=UPI003DA06A0F
MFAGVDVTGVDDLLSSPSARIATEIAQDAQRSENRCAAAKVIAAGRLHEIRFAAISAGEDGLGPQFGNIADKGATVEVATTLGVSTSKATTLIGLAIALDALPDLRAAFLNGDMDIYRTTMIATTIDTHEPIVRKQLEAEAIRLDAETAMSHRQLRDRLEAMCIELDPEQAARDREDFAEQQDFRVKPDRHGHAVIAGCVPAQDGREIEARVADLVATLCHGDPRWIGQKRAAAHLALIRGETTLSCWCGADDCPSASDAPSAELVPVRTLVVVHADAPTPAGHVGAMTPWIDGHGAIDPVLVRRLAADATWQEMYGDTLTAHSQTSASGARRGRRHPAGTIGCIRDGHRQTSGHTPAPGPPPGALTYTPSQSLRDWITDHDQHCRFPFCNQPPDACEIDHQIPLDHTDPAGGGWTIRINLALLCVLHHHVKTAGLWHAHMHPDRSITWTHRDTGAAFTTHPVR